MIQLLSLFLVLADNGAFVDEDEGEAFDFDSDDDIPEADHPPPEAHARKNSPDSVESSLALPNPDLPDPSNTSKIAPSLADATATSRPFTAGGETAEEVTSAAEGGDDRKDALPPPPPVNSDSKQTGL